MKEKGITLIALVITIIVLLILAGISLSITIGENGILSKAKESKMATEKAQGAEMINMAVAGSYGADARIDIVGLLNKNLKQIDGLTYKDNPIDETDVNKRINSLPAKVKLNGYTYKIKGDGTVKESDPNEISIDQIRENKLDYYGKFITNYDLQANEGMSLTRNSDLSNWRIFLVDDERIYLIATDRICRFYTGTKNGVGFDYDITQTDTKSVYPMWFNSIKNQYSKTDIPEILSKFSEYEKNHYHLWLKDNMNSDLECIPDLAAMLDVDLWNDYKNEKYASYAIGGPTVEMIVDSFNAFQNENSVKLELSITDNRYSIKRGETDSVVFEYVYPDNNGADLLYHGDNSASWVATPDGSDLRFVKYNGLYWNHPNYTNWLGFRPVVCLKEGVGLIAHENANGDVTFTLED